MRIISLKCKIFIGKCIDIHDVRIEFHGRNWSGRSGDLFGHLLDLITVDMCISDKMDELSHFESSHLCYHHSQ